MTGAQQLIEQGFEKGREQGRAEIVLRLLAVKFGPLPSSVLHRLQQADSAELD